jgi:site-specific DNA recombinase
MSETNQPYLRSVLYLRVSTKEQAERGGESEGFSIPAQRDACLRKAAALNAVVVEQFIDRGESAKSARRPELQRMLAFVAEEQVDYVIVHKIDRLARNRVDDVEISLALRKAGATLVSCTENIDETPSGALLHGIMSSIAEFYSRNLANEVNKGLIQKAKNGGTPTKAPIGYLNVRQFDEGREIRTVEIDQERAPLVVWAFKTYATGEWTVRTLLAEATKKGLLSKPTPKRPARHVAISAFHQMLKNPYYIGMVRYRGVVYPGKHAPIIDRQTFDEVQRLLEAHNFAGEKQRAHHHYLKGSIFCGKEHESGAICEARLIVTNAKSRTGRIYPYFICIGRQRNPSSCGQRAVLIQDVEDEILDLYRGIELSEDLKLQTEQVILEQIAELRESAGNERQQLVTRQRRALNERAKLLEAHYEGAVPLDLLKIEQERISRELNYVEERLAALELKFDIAQQNLKAALTFVASLDRAYEEADQNVKRQMNQALFTRILVSDAGDVNAELREPFHLLFQAIGTAPDGLVRHHRDIERPRGPVKGPRGLNKHSLVELAGLEPATSWVRSADLLRSGAATPGQHAQLRRAAARGGGPLGPSRVLRVDFAVDF